MQMVITGRFVFPATNYADPFLLGKHQARFPSAAVANQQLMDYEEQVSRVVQESAAAEDPLMIFELDGIARQPPPAILEHLHTLDRKFKLGARLRQSRDPDFLMEMVSASDVAVGNGASSSADSAWWIADIVCEDFETVQYLPHGCLCKLLLLALRGRNASLPGAVGTTDQGKAAFNKSNLRSIIPRLLMKLREFLADVEESQIEIATSVVLYYLECLSSPDLPARHVASQVLHLLTSSNLNGSANGSSAETESMSTPLTSDLESIEDEITAFDSMLGGVGFASMSFGWISDLVKFPCYSRVRPKIFTSLEGLLERESSIPALRSCIKALYEFWNDDAMNSDDTSKKDASGLAPKPSKSAIEKSLMLAGAYGRLLSGREFVGKLLLRDRRVFSTIADAMWKVIELQLTSPPQLKASVGISFSDCKVFYVADTSNAIREIKLPLSVIHGAILALCSPHARDDGSARDVKTTSVRSSDPSYRKLTQSLFPKAMTGTAILSSTGLIATKDARLYPDHLLAKLAASSSDPYLCRTAVRAMACDAVWELLQLSALQESCFAVVVQTLLDILQSNEAKVTAGLQAATNGASVEDAATQVLAALAVYKCDPASSTNQHARFMPSTMERLLALERWLRKVSSASKADSEMDVDQGKEDDDDREEENLLSEGFASFAVSNAGPRVAPQEEKLKRTSFYSSKPLVKVFSSAKKTKVSSTEAGEQPTADETAYFEANYPYLRKMAPSPSASVSSSSDMKNSVVWRLIDALCGGCEDEAGESGDAASEAWQLRVSLLHYINASCFTRERVVELARGLHGILNHICRCSRPSHRLECCEVIQQVLRNVEASLSYSDTVVFIQHVVQVGSAQRLASLTHGDPDVSRHAAVALERFAEFVAHTLVRWNNASKPLTLDAVTIRGIVVLLKDIAVLRGALAEGLDDMDANQRAVTWTQSTLLWLIVGDCQDSSVLVDVIDAVVGSMPHFTKFHKDTLRVLDNIRRKMIGVRLLSWYPAFTSDGLTCSLLTLLGFIFQEPQASCDAAGRVISWVGVVDQAGGLDGRWLGACCLNQQ